MEGWIIYKNIPDGEFIKHLALDVGSEKDVEFAYKEGFRNFFVTPKQKNTAEFILDSPHPFDAILWTRKPGEGGIKIPSALMEFKNKMDFVKRTDMAMVMIQMACYLKMFRNGSCDMPPVCFAGSSKGFSIFPSSMISWIVDQVEVISGRSASSEWRRRPGLVKQVSEDPCIRPFTISFSIGLPFRGISLSDIAGMLKIFIEGDRVSIPTGISSSDYAPEENIFCFWRKYVLKDKPGSPFLPLDIFMKCFYEIPSNVIYTGQNKGIIRLDGAIYIVDWNLHMFIRGMIEDYILTCPHSPKKAVREFLESMIEEEVIPENS